MELNDLFEPDFPSDTTIVIHRNGKKIFSFHDPKTEFYGNNDLFAEHRVNGKESYLIFRCSDRPSEDYFMAENYKIFEVREGFPLDKPLMDALLPIIIKNERERLKSYEQSGK